MLQAIVRVCQIVFLVLAIAALGWFLYDRWSQDRRIELDPYRRVLAERAVGRVVDELPRKDAIKRLLVLPVAGDVHGHVTDMLVNEVEERRDEYIVVDARDFEGVKTPANVAEGLAIAKKLAKEARPDGILQPTASLDYGRKGVGATVTVEAKLVTLDAKANFPSDTVQATEKIESRFSVDHWSATMEQTSSLLRLGLWIVGVAGLPFAIFPVVQSVTRRENNRLNAALISGLVAFDLLLALVLMGIRPGGAFGWLLLVLAGFAGFVYNFEICDRIDEMRK